MSWGIIVYQSDLGKFYSLVMSDDTVYDHMKESLSKQKDGLTFLNGKKGISDEKIDEISNSLSNLIIRLNNREQLDVKAELTAIF